MRALQLLVLTLLLIPGSIISVASASIVSTSEYKPGEILVKYRDDMRRDRNVMGFIYDLVQVEKVKRFGGNMRSMEQLFVKKDANLQELIAKLEKHPAVEYAQPNFILRALPIAEARRPSSGMPCIPGFEVPGCDPDACMFPGFPPGCKDDGGGSPGEPGNPTPPSERPAVGEKPADVNPPVADPELEKAYGIGKIGSDEAWKTTRGSQDVVVAVIDTGVDYNHEDLSFNMWRNPNPDKNDLVGWDFIHNDNLPFDDNMHGTHCAGSIGAVGGNGKGVSGVNQRVSIMALKFLSGEGSGDTAGAIKAIDYAIGHGAKVLSNSWGGKGDEDNKGLREAIARAEAKDVLFVAAAGNDSSDNDKDPTWPASFNEPNMLTVAATDKSDAMASFSNYGVKSVHLGAPGAGIYSTVPGNSYKSLSGTSMACPHVAGAAALVWAAHPKYTHKEVKKCLMESVDQISALNGKTITGGRLNVAKAVLCK